MIDSKDQIIELLKKTPIIQAACQKAGISRATFYRWRLDDESFSIKVDKALSEGRKLINDFAESKIIAAIGEGNLTAGFYWLNHNHKRYSNRVRISGEVKTTRKISSEEIAKIEKDLRMLFPYPKNDQKRL